MRLDQGTTAQRFTKNLLLYAAIFVPVVVVTWSGWWLGERLAQRTGYDWLQMPVGIAVILVVFAAVSTLLDRKRGE